MSVSIMLALAAMLMLAMSDMLFKLESKNQTDTPVLEYFFYMSLFAFLCAIPFNIGSIGQVAAHPSNLLYGALLGFLAVGCYVCYLSAFAGLAASANITIYRMALVPALLFSALMLSEALTVFKLIGVGCCLGAILLFSEHELTHPVNLRFIALSLTACVLSGLITPLSKVATLHGADADSLLFCRFGFMALFAAGFLGVRHIRFHIRRQPLLLAGGSGVLLFFECTTVLKAISMGDVGMVTPITSMSFLLTGVAGSVLYKEKLTLSRALAMLLAVLTVFFITRG